MGVINLTQMRLKPQSQRFLARNRIDEALSLLGISEDSLSYETIKAAYHSALKSAHPDTGGDSSQAARQIVALKKARDILYSYLSSDSEPQKCAYCGGHGYTGGGMLAKKCKACGGKKGRQFNVEV